MTVLNADELQGAEWILWIENLAVMDPYFVLPVLMGASMWFQQKITPTNFTDPLQEKIFKWFPVIMTVFFIYFPSGLVLYWLVNNIFTIAQVNRIIEKQGTWYLSWQFWTTFKRHLKIKTSVFALPRLTGIILTNFKFLIMFLWTK